MKDNNNPELNPTLKGIIENCIADCVQELVGCDRPNRFTDVNKLCTEANVTSELLMLTKQRFGFHITPDIMSNEKSIASISKMLSVDRNFAPDPLATLKENTIGPRIVFIPGFGGNAWNYQEVANNMMTPCTIESLNLFNFYPNEANNLTEQGMLNSITERLKKLKGNKPIWIGGFSFGGFIAPTVAQMLKDHVEISGLMLIDPRPLNKLRLASYIPKVIAYHLMKYSGLGSALTNAQMFEKNMLYRRLTLRKNLRNFSANMPKIPGKVLISTEVAQQYPLSSYFEVDESLCEVTEVEVGHTEILRSPFAKQTANWIDKAIA